MSGVDVLAGYAQDTGAFRVSNKGATELAAACAAVAELIEAAIAVSDSERNSHTACEVDISALNRLDAAITRCRGAK